MPVLDRLRLRLKASLGIIAFISSGIHAFAAEGSPIPGSNTDGELMRWAVTQGGLFLFTAIMGWSYKRDWERVFIRQHEALENERTRNDAVMEILKESTAAHVKSAAAAESLKQVSYEVANVVRATFQAPRFAPPRDNG